MLESTYCIISGVGMRKAKVLIDYCAEAVDELDLSVGEEVVILGMIEDGWLKGRVKGKEGIFPENFVEEIKKPPKMTKLVPVRQAPPPPGKYFVIVDRTLNGCILSILTLLSNITVCLTISDVCVCACACVQFY